MIDDVIDVMHSTWCLLCKTRDLEGSIRVCGDAVLLDFWCCFAKIFIFSCHIAVLKNQVVCGLLCYSVRCLYVFLCRFAVSVLPHAPLNLGIRIIDHIQYIKILTWLNKALGTKLQNVFDSVAWQFFQETWAQRKQNQISKWPESLGVMFRIFPCAHEGRMSVAPYLRKCGKLHIREILVIMWPYVRPIDPLTDCPSAPQAYQCKITQSTGIVTQMQLKLILVGNRIATCLLWSRDMRSSAFTMAYLSFKEMFDFTLK